MINTIAPRYWTVAGDARLIGSMTVLERGTGLPVGPALSAAAIAARE